jgi:hypothetical protein
MDNFCTDDELVIDCAFLCCRQAHPASDMATANGLQQPLR